MNRPCLGWKEERCGKPTPRERCPRHARMADRAHHNRAYDDPRYKAFRSAFLLNWRATYGDLCPGDETHAAHETSDLTLDHVVSLAYGGPLLDAANAHVLCRAANGAKGARSVTVGAR